MKNIVRCHVIWKGKSHHRRYSNWTSTATWFKWRLYWVFYAGCWCLCQVSTRSILGTMFWSFLCHNFVLRLITSPPTHSPTAEVMENPVEPFPVQVIRSHRGTLSLLLSCWFPLQTIVNSRHWSEHARPTDQEIVGRSEQITVCYASASDVAGMLIDLGTTASKVVDPWLVCPYIEAAEICCAPYILLYSGCL